MLQPEATSNDHTLDSDKNFKSIVECSSSALFVKFTWNSLHFMFTCSELSKLHFHTFPSYEHLDECKIAMNLVICAVLFRTLFEIKFWKSFIDKNIVYPSEFSHNISITVTVLFSKQAITITNIKMNIYHYQRQFRL